MLQYPGVIPADGMVHRLGMFGYGRLVREAFDARVSFRRVLSRRVVSLVYTFPQVQDTS